MNLQVLALMMLHAFDALQRVTDEQDNHADRGDFLTETSNNDGPILSFFTESWHVNSYNKKNYDTCQLL